MRRGYYNANIETEKTDKGTKTEFSIAFGAYCVVVTVHEFDHYVQPIYQLRVIDSYSKNVTSEFFRELPDVTHIPCENLTGAFKMIDELANRSFLIQT